MVTFGGVEIAQTSGKKPSTAGGFSDAKTVGESQKMQSPCVVAWLDLTQSTNIATKLTCSSDSLIRLNIPKEAVEGLLRIDERLVRFGGGIILQLHSLSK